MTIVLRAILIILSVLVFILMMRKIRQAKVRIEDALFWVLFSLLLIVFSAFPKVADLLSDLVGTISTANFVFMLIIFLLLIKLFQLSIHVSQLETRVKELVQKIALEEAERQEGKEHE